MCRYVALGIRHIFSYMSSIRFSLMPIPFSHSLLLHTHIHPRLILPSLIFPFTFLPHPPPFYPQRAFSPPSLPLPTASTTRRLPSSYPISPPNCSRSNTQFQNLSITSQMDTGYPLGLTLFRYLTLFLSHTLSLLHTVFLFLSLILFVSFLFSLPRLLALSLLQVHSFISSCLITQLFKYVCSPIHSGFKLIRKFVMAVDVPEEEDER